MLFCFSVALLAFLRRAYVVWYVAPLRARARPGLSAGSLAGKELKPARSGLSAGSLAGKELKPARSGLSAGSLARRVPSVPQLPITHTDPPTNGLRAANGAAAHASKEQLKRGKSAIVHGSEDWAATKIQCSFRGNKSRKQHKATRTSGWHSRSDRDDIRPSPRDTPNFFLPAYMQKDQQKEDAPNGDTHVRKYEM